MRTVLAHGTFDLLHIGHVKMFWKARTLGDLLVVTLTGDKFVNKGLGRPIYNEYERAEFIRSLRMIDLVEVIQDKSGLPAIEKYRPDVYCKGADYKFSDKHGALDVEREAVEKMGGQLVLLDHAGWSSSSIIERVRRMHE